MTFNAQPIACARSSISFLTDTTKVLMSMCSIFFVPPLDEENKASGMNCHLLHCVMKSWCVSHFRRHITCDFLPVAWLFPNIGQCHRLRRIIHIDRWCVFSFFLLSIIKSMMWTLDGLTMGALILRKMKSASQWFLIESNLSLKEKLKLPKFGQSVWHDK